MSLVYEITQGSKIHFGKSAKIKRDVENLAVKIFYESGFEEIQTPIFNFDDSSILSRKAIRISTNDNRQLALRNDNTIDVIKIINRHLSGVDGKIQNQKWFYIQPAFSYPNNEINQIGAECIHTKGLDSVICVAINIAVALKISPILQISNMNIPKLCAKESGLEIDTFSQMRLDRLLKQDSYFVDLLSIQTKNDLESYIPKSPEFLKCELEKLLESSSYCHYERTIFSPLYYSPFGYYDSLSFRMFSGNRVLLLGGEYEIDGIHSSGFALYTNDVVEYILNNEVKL